VTGRGAGACLALALAAAVLGTGAAQAQGCMTEKRQHCGGLRGKSGIDRFDLRGRVLRGVPRLEVTSTGLRASSASLVGRPSNARTFAVSWRAGGLSCVHYTVRYCPRPGN
jgi:hypothetical protein